jgi:hypothetical protein
MRTVVLIVVAYIAAHAFFYGVGWYAESQGVSRFVERGIFYSETTFADLVTDPARSRYLVPVLFPLDLMVMLLLAGALAWAGYVLGPVAFPNWPAFAFLILPLAYLAFDIAEDSFLALLLSHSVPIAPYSIPALKTLTAVKLTLVWLSEAVVWLTGFMAWRAWPG